MSDDFDNKLESKAAEAGGGVADVQRPAPITGIGRRPRWPKEDKAGIVLESLQGGVSISEVARRHGLSPQRLFAWRHAARALLHEGGSAAAGDGSAANPAPRPRRGKGRPKPAPEIRDDAPAFAPVVISASAGSSPSRSSQPSPIASGTIEIAIGDAVVRVIGQVETEALVAVLHAVRRAS